MRHGRGGLGNGVSVKGGSAATRQPGRANGTAGGEMVRVEIRSPLPLRQGLRLGSFDSLADVWAAVSDSCSEGLAAFLDNPTNRTGARPRPPPPPPPWSPLLLGLHDRSEADPPGNGRATTTTTTTSNRTGARACPPASPAPLSESPSPLSRLFRMTAAKGTHQAIVVRRVLCSGSGSGISSSSGGGVDGSSCGDVLPLEGLILCVGGTARSDVPGCWRRRRVR